MDASLRRSDLVVTCNSAGVPLDVAEKLDAHREGVLHLAVSVFLFTGSSRLLLQQRAASKYHSGGLWSNSACTHPMPDETPVDAAGRAVTTELGITTKLSPAFVTVYDVAVGSAMHENEYNQVFAGHCSVEDCAFDKREVEAVKTLTLDELKRDADANPELYTPWLRFMMTAHFDDIRKAMNSVARAAR